MRLLLAALAALVVLLPTAAVAAAPHHRPHDHRDHGRHDNHRPVVPCSRGLVALTFDDGPLAAVTPRLVRLLQRLEVPATFFMVGNRVEQHPELVRMVDRAGFAIGNHTWAHTDLTTQTPVQARRALVSTRHALLEAGVTPTDLARPPYGAVDDRVRHVMSALGLVPVLWTIDSRDWSHLSPRQITARVVRAVRPHRTNVVLQHDGVTNSRATLRAVPQEVAVLRGRGYCFASLDAAGEPTPPVPIATIVAGRARITEGDRVRLAVLLDRPTSRAVTVRTTAGTVRIPAGRQSDHLWFRAPQDRTDEKPEDVTFRVYAGRGIEPAPVAQARVRVLDDDPAPVVSLDDVSVTASPLLPTPARIDVRLDRARDRDLRLVVRSELGPARVVVPAYARHAADELTVPVGRPSQPVHRVPLHVAGVPGATATLTVRPPTQTRREVAAGVVAGIHWPAAPVVRLF